MWVVARFGDVDVDVVDLCEFLLKGKCLLCNSRWRLHQLLSASHPQLNEPCQRNSPFMDVREPLRVGLSVVQCSCRLSASFEDSYRAD